MPDNHARILRGVAGVYLLHNPETGFKAKAKPRGLFRKFDQSPLPGDLVEYESSDDPGIPWVITRILERKNELRRPPLANLDKLFLTAAAELPRADYHYLDRMLACCMFEGIEPILLLTKCDLPGTEEAIEYFKAYYGPSGFSYYLVSLEDDKVLSCLREHTHASLVAFAGQSGVGKSTLMNRLLGKEHLETGDISRQGGRGRQTTRSTEIYAMDDGYLADTPGFQSLNIETLDLEGPDLLLAYPELQAIQHECRFADCHHLGELGCAVDHAQIHPDRLEIYRKLRRDLDEYDKYR